MGEWIEHDGKGMPVPNDTPVAVKFRGGGEIPERWRSKAHEWCWDWVDDSASDGMRSGDIISYRILSDPHAPTPSGP